MVNVMRRYASGAFVLGLALVAAGCGSSHAIVHGGPPAAAARDISRHSEEPENHVGPGPFALSGGFASGGTGGLLGDGWGSNARGTRLGCQDGERWSYAFGLVNRLNAPVTVTGVRAPNPARAIADRVATQLRLSPPQPPPSKVVNGFGPPIGLVYRHWSAAPTHAVTIPPRRMATIQSNFLMTHCSSLAPGRTISIPARFVFAYRKSGHHGAQVIGVPSMRLLIGAGVVPHACEPVAGTAYLTAVGLGCADARAGVQACNPLPRAHKTHSLWNGGTCTVSGATWSCGRFEGPGWPFLETCYSPNDKTQWFSTVWMEGGLGLWGAVQNRPARDVNAPQAGPPTGGVCHVRGGTLEYVSSSLALGGRWGGHARDGRVTFSIGGYRGPGTYRATAHAQNLSTAVQLSTPGALYGALFGKVRVARATKHSVSGMVYVYLRRSDGPERAALKGTWSCQTGD
jgi:hypothetical protein